MAVKGQDAWSSNLSGAGDYSLRFVRHVLRNNVTERLAPLTFDSDFDRHNCGTGVG